MSPVKLLNAVIAVRKDEVGEILKRATAINMDNVSNYFWKTGKLDWDIERDFPNVAPPFENYWAEFGIPVAAQIGSRFGYHVYSLYRDHSWNVLTSVWAWVRGMPDPCEPLARFHWNVGADGRLSPDGRAAYLTPNYKAFVEKVGGDPAVMLKQFNTFLFTVFIGTCFMHSKNVTMRGLPAQPRSQKLDDYKPFSVKYQVLDIDPMKEILRREGRSDEVGLKRALTTCQGHFRTYGRHLKDLSGAYLYDGNGVPVTGPGMFGKDSLKGTYWIPERATGSSDYGVIVKDYNVLAPKEDIS